MAARRDVPTVALHGAGLIASVHATAAAALGWPIAAVASRSSARAGALAERTGATPSNYGELPGRADLVIVATPPADHAPAALRLLEEGVAVAVEKPLCTTLADADRLVAAAEAHDHRLLYAENLAHAPVVIEMLRAVRDVGRLTYLEARSLQARPTWGDFLTEAWGGGALFDLGVHPLALTLLVAGDDAPVSVRADLSGGPGHPTDEHAEVELRFASGLRARVVSSWRAGPDQVWDVQAVTATDVVRAELLPEPRLEHNGVRLPVPGVPKSPLALLHEAGYLGQLVAFAEDLSAHRRPVMDAVFGRRVLEVVCGAYHSAGLGEAVALPFAGPRDRTPLELWRNSSR